MARPAVPFDQLPPELQARIRADFPDADAADTSFDDDELSRRRSLRELAAAAAAQLDPALPAEQRALEVQQVLTRARPDTTAAGRRRAAERATGAPPAPSSEAAAGIGARGDRVARSAARRRRRAARGARSLAGDAVTNLGVRPGPGGALRGVVVQSLGLVVLYWLLRNADAADRVAAGLRDALGWLRSPIGVPGDPKPPGSGGGGGRHKTA